MFLEERYEKIVEEIETKGRATVKELSKKFNVTDDCIRKDLRELENRGKLKRVHGGAIPKKIQYDFKKLEERKGVNSDKKKQIAIKAIELIKDRETIFLDISTINIEIAKLIAKRDLNITVVTNMIEIVLELKQCKNVRSILIGGEFHKRAEGILGSEAERNIRRFTLSRSFIGICAVNRESGFISSLDIEDGNIKKSIIESSNKTYLVMESDKFDYDEFYKFASLDEITGIITEIEILEGEYND